MSDKPEYPFNADQLAWLRDLETTEEPQTKEWLHVAVSEGSRKEGFCCLGRACVVLGAETIERDGFIFTYDGADTDLPESLVKKLRLRSKDGKLGKAFNLDGRYIGYLVVMNDEGNMTFKEIAAYIRANPWNVFRDPEDNS